VEITNEVNGRVFRRANAALKGDMWADDVAQHILMKLWLYADGINEPLLKVLLKNAIADIKFERHEDIDDYAETIPYDEDIPTFDKLRMEFEHIRLKVKLTKKQRRLLAYVMNHNIPYSKACKMVGFHDYEYYKMIEKFKEVLDD
jgi:hypothetical protein